MKLDWKWIAIGAVIMLALSIVAGLATGLILRPQLAGVTEIEDISLSNGQIALISLINFLAFVIGGFIVGRRSAGRTILEPGISAALAVVVLVLVSGGLSLANIVAGALVPFLAGVLGGWLGERSQMATGNVRHARS